MVGHDREDLVSGRLRWTDLTPPEWRDLDAGPLTGEERQGAYDRLRRSTPQGRQPCAVLIGAAAFDEQRNEGVAFVLDLTERQAGGSRSP